MDLVEAQAESLFENQVEMEAEAKVEGDYKNLQARNRRDAETKVIFNTV